MYLDSDGKIVSNSSLIPINGRVNTAQGSQIGLILRKADGSPITPADITAINAYWGERYHQFPAGTSNLTTTVAANTGVPRSGNIVLKSKAGATTYAIPINQAGATGNITATPSTIEAGYVHLPVTVALTSFGTWSISQRDPWITPSQYDGPSGTTAVTLKIGDNTSNDARTGTITFYNQFLQQIAVVTVNQAGAPTSISATPTKVTGTKAGGDSVPVICVSSNSWTVASAPSWVFIAPTSGSAGSGIVGVGFDQPNSTGGARTGQIRIENTTTHEIAICLITQEG